MELPEKSRGLFGGYVYSLSRSVSLGFWDNVRWGVPSVLFLIAFRLIVGIGEGRSLCIFKEGILYPRERLRFWQFTDGVFSLTSRAV